MEIEEHQIAQSGKSEDPKPQEPEETKAQPEKDDCDLEMTDDQAKLWGKIEKILEEYFLSQF